MAHLWGSVRILLSQNFMPVRYGFFLSTWAVIGQDKPQTGQDDLHKAKPAGLCWVFSRQQGWFGGVLTHLCWCDGVHILWGETLEQCGFTSVVQTQKNYSELQLCGSLQLLHHREQTLKSTNTHIIQAYWVYIVKRLTFCQQKKIYFEPDWI